MKHVITHKDSVHKGEMYRIVFECVYVKVAIALLLFAFMLQPIAPAYANEVAESEASVEVEEVAPEPEEEPEAKEEVVPETVEDSVEEVLDDSEDASVSEEFVADEGDVAASAIGDTNEEVDNTTESEEVLVSDAEETDIDTSGVSTSTETTEEDVVDTVASGDSVSDGSSGVADGESSPEPEDEPPERDVGDTFSTSTATSSNDTGTSTHDVSKDVLENDDTADEEEVVRDDDASEENTSSSTDEASEVVEVVRYVNQFNSDLNKYQFSDSECVSVGDGSFYCSKNDLGSGTTPDDAVFARPDGDGDKEIFITIEGKTIQITDNKLEDIAPYYDPLSHSVVWHRLIDGRYEIMLYDLKTETEEKLTNNRVNDMEPSRSGQYVVWQRWVEDNWEIVLFDGEEEMQITSSKTHDVGAHIKGGYVIWNTNDTNGERLVMVYEIETGLISEIKDADGGMVENPRFVLVYDTTHDNGDVITKGYDFESGEVVPLAAVPKPMPAEIPEPDSTGETRALIQSKSSNNEDEIVELDTDTATGTVKTITKSTTSTTSVSADADQTGSSTVAIETEKATTTIDMAVEEVENLELTDFDLIVPPFFEASSTQNSISPRATSSVE